MRVLFPTLLLYMMPALAQPQWTLNDETVTPSSSCSASANRGSVATNSSGNLCQCSNATGSYQWNCAATTAAAVPSGSYVFIKSGTCPSGYTEDDALATYNILVTTTAAGDVGTSAAQSLTAAPQTINALTAAAQAFTGDSDTTSAVSAGTPAGTVTAPTFTGSQDTTSAVSAGTPAGTNSGAAFSITTQDYNTGTTAYGPKSLGGTTLASGTTSITLSTQPTFTGSALATHTHTLTPTGTNSAPAFTGSALDTHTHTLTPTGTNSTSAVTGTMNSSVVTGNTAYFKMIACEKN